MRYYSDKLNELFDNEENLTKAEHDFDVKERQKEQERKAKSEARAARAKEIDEARSAMVEARKAYVKLVNNFAKDFGSYHSTITNIELPDFLYFL